MPGKFSQPTFSPEIAIDQRKLFFTKFSTLAEGSKPHPMPSHRMYTCVSTLQWLMSSTCTWELRPSVEELFLLTTSRACLLDIFLIDN